MGCIQKYEKMWNYELNAAVILLPLPVHSSCAPDASNLQRCKIIYCPHPVGSTEGPEDDFKKENPVYDF